MATYTTLKRMVANHLGKTDHTTANTIRDNAINDAYTQICQEYPFSWLLIPGTDLTLSSNEADLASDYNPSFGIHHAYTESSGTADDHVYVRVAIKDWDNYASGGSSTATDYVYYIEYDSTNDVYVFHSNQSSGTVKYFYFKVPSELSNGTDVCVVPDPTAVVYLAVAKWWLATERNEEMYQMFYKMYQERLMRMIKNDQMKNTMRQKLATGLDEASGTKILATKR